MRNTRRAYLPALALMAVVGLVLALCLLPAGALADSAATDNASSGTTSSTTETGAPNAAGTTLTTGEASGAAGSDAGANESGASGTGATSTSPTDTETTVTTPTATTSSSEKSGAQALFADLEASDPVAVAAATADTVQIIYDESDGGTHGLHYVYSVPGDTTSTKIYLYCMNNDDEWPHSVPTAPTVPDYVLGYLTPNMFASEADYEACMAKLLAILYAGYPYNGLNYYTEVTSVNITEEEFNELLDAPSYIRSDFPDSIGDATFVWTDYTNDEKMAKLNKFLYDVATYFPVSGQPAKTTPSGLTYSQLVNTPFYTAALCMVNAYYNQSTTTPLKEYDSQNSGTSLELTRLQAYDQTQDAIWVVLHDYGVPENSMTADAIKNEPLAKLLYESASASDVLESEPTGISITGSMQFTYDAATRTWRTGALSISENGTYHGAYALSVSDSGVYVNTATGVGVSTVTAGQSFYLVSPERPTADVTVSATDTVPWLEEVRQYSPVKKADGSEYTVTVTVKNKDDDGTITTSTLTKYYQHMIGAVIHTKTLNASAAITPPADGQLTVSKTVTGETNSQTSFTFTVTLSDTTINGTYGDMSFTNGVATVTLKGGQSATAKYLPGGTTYTVTEASNSDYAASASELAGTVPSDGTAATAAFTNTRLYKLTLSKTVSGQAASTSQQFAMHVTLKDASGNPLTGTYAYTGGTVDGSSATAPADGTITLDANGTGTVELSHGQQVTIAGIPSGTTYTVEEAASTAADALLYDATYNGNVMAPTATLSADAAVAMSNAVQEGSLSVTKHVKGEVGSTQAFTFTVKLGGSGATLTGTYGDMEFSNGQATFTLTDGKTKTATALPAGATYEVIEESNDKYTTTSENATGTISKGATAQASFTNTRGMTTLPLSGGAGFGVTYAVGLGALAAAAAWMHARRHAAGKGGDGRD